MKYPYVEDLAVVLLILSCIFIFGDAIRGIYREFAEKKKGRAGAMPKQVFELTYRDEKEERAIRQWKESGFRDYFKKLNDQRCECGAGESPLPGPLESIRAFFIRWSK